LAQRVSSPQLTTKTMASLPLVNWRITPSISPSSSKGSSRFGIFTFGRSAVSQEVEVG
jgi:hypothetical protein